MAATEGLAPEAWFHDLATSYVEAQILFHLNQAGVFDVLREAPQTSADLASACGVDARLLDCLLEYLHAVDALLQRDAEGRYSFSGFGRDVLARYSGGDGRLNLFDVRVGAYGPVWSQLGAMLKGDAAYGRDVVRSGAYAADGVDKMAARLAPCIERVLLDVGAEVVVCLGASGGLLRAVRERRPAVHRISVDRDPTSLDASLSATVCADIFDVAAWAAACPRDARGVLLSVHLHEFLARGQEAMIQLFQDMRRTLPGWHVLALEQDRLPDEARSTTPRSEWLYAQANVLIHHLIGNGRILERASWLDLYARAGCRLHSVQPADYLGYSAYVVRL